jgi:hypothetical protein
MLTVFKINVRVYTHTDMYTLSSHRIMVGVISLTGLLLLPGTQNILCCVLFVCMFVSSFFFCSCLLNNWLLDC